MTANASPVNCGEGGGLGARSVVGDDGGSCDSGTRVVVVIVAGGSSRDSSADDSDSVGSSDGSGALSGGRDTIFGMASTLGRGTGAGGLL